MKIFSRYITLICIVFAFWVSTSYAAINFTVTPIRYELEMAPGESKTLPASIKNNGTGSVFLPTATSDFISNGVGGTPSFVRKSELVFPDQQLSTWISLSSSGITLSPWQEKTISFDIDVPETATPGWHYGAVFFKNPGSESGGGNIGINVDYGILVLVTVSGEIEVELEIDDPIISWAWTARYDKCDGEDTSGSIYDGDCGESEMQESDDEIDDTAWYIWEDINGTPLYQYMDSCPFWDFTISKYDGKCIGSPSEDDNEPLLFSDDFEIDFLFPIKNTGNTHIKPTGKVTLIDENGDTIKAIWKETVENERGAIIGHKIVDYLPINDEWWNILPTTKRIFESVWKGFPYKTYDDRWNPDIAFWTPSEFYTNKNKEDGWFLMPWERVSEVRQSKIITADIELIYYDEKWNPITFNTAKEFNVQYIEQQITFNPYVILALLLLLAIIIMTWFAIRWWIILWKKKAKCWNCEEEIKSHWETCPHCKAIQDKKKHKKFQEQQKKETSKKEKVKKKK